MRIRCIVRHFETENRRVGYHSQRKKVGSTLMTTSV
jgi:hypothetical protein